MVYSIIILQTHKGIGRKSGNMKSGNWKYTVEQIAD